MGQGQTNVQQSDNDDPPEWNEGVAGMEGENVVPPTAIGQVRQPPVRRQQPELRKTRVVKNPVNLKKETLEIKRDETQVNIYHLSFVVDANEDCAISIYFVTIEDKGTFSGTPYRAEIDKGIGQRFDAGPDGVLDIMKHPTTQLIWDSAEPDVWPVVIHCATKADPGKGQITYCSIKPGNGRWQIEVVKQKVQVGNKIYEVQDVYGIEKQATGENDVNADDIAGAPECVICMSEQRDTAVLPCRHMCLCNQCANVMRMQCSKCPICRQPVSSLLQICINEGETTEVEIALGGSTETARDPDKAPDAAQTTPAPNSGP